MRVKAVVAGLAMLGCANISTESESLSIGVTTDTPLIEHVLKAEKDLFRVVNFESEQQVVTVSVNTETQDCLTSGGDVFEVSMFLSRDEEFGDIEQLESTDLDSISCPTLVFKLDPLDYKYLAVTPELTNQVGETYKIRFLMKANAF